MSQTIESANVNISTIFQAFYAVPAYQREYVWKAEQVEQLLTDVQGEMPAGPQAGTPAEYLLVASSSAQVRRTCWT